MPLSGDWSRLAADLGRMAAGDRLISQARDRLRAGAETIAQDAQGRLGSYQAGWAPLADSTQAERERLGFAPDAPLLRTGALRDAITVQEESQTSFLVGVPAESDQAQIALAQEMGTLTSGGFIPPRPFLLPAAEAHADEIGSQVSRATLEDLGID